MTDVSQPTPEPPQAPPPSAPAGPPPAMQKYAQQMEGVQQADAAALEQRNAAMLKPMSALSSINAQPMPQPGPQQKLGPAPDAKEFQKDAMAFASAMAVLGAVAGRFTRAPGGAALSAFAGALKGWQTGNLQAYETAAKKWEQDTKATLDNNRMVMEKYKTALENRKMNIDEQMSQIELISSQYHDQIMYDAAAAKNYTMVARIYEKNFEYTQKASDAAAKLQERRTEQTQQQQERAPYWMSPAGQAELNAVNPDGSPKYSITQKAMVNQMIELYGKKGAGGGAQTPEKVALAKFQEEHPNATSEDIQNFRNTGKQPRSAAGMSLQQFIAETKAKTGQPPSAAEIQAFSARQAGLNAEERTGATTAANLDIIMRNAHAAIPMAVEASKKVPRGTWVPLNRLMQTADSAISDPALKEFKIANLQLAELWARAMNPKGVMRESDRALALEMLSTADSPQTYERVAKQLENFLQRERKAVQEFREHREPEQHFDPSAPSPTAGKPAAPAPGKYTYDPANGQMKPDAN